MTTTLEHPKATVHIVKLDGQRSKISVDPKADLFVPTRECLTRYPLDLIEHVLRTKGPIDLCDEIRRDEDPAYIEHNFRWSILSYVSARNFSGKRVLDFGCGCGSSSLVLARLFPASAHIVGVDLSRDYIDLARHRSRIFGLDNRLSFHVSPEPDNLPSGIGQFDYVVLSAVYEHLLPHERLTLLPLLWSHTNPGGVVFLNQTPFRWFPVETHTTGLPLINYFPERLALACARHFAKKVGRDESWVGLLRRGIRGGTRGEILEYLERDEKNARLLEPGLLDVSDRVGLWYRMSSGSRAPLAKRLMMYGFRLIKAATGRTVVPGLSLAIKKVT